MIDLTELLADCDALGVRLIPAVDGGLIVEAPQSAATPDLLAHLKAHKSELLALLRPALAVQPQPRPTMKPTAKPVCRCGSMAWRDVPIHDGQSLRRDCAGCGRFIDFPVWHAKTTLRNEQ
jgi:hypothetical protein